MNILIVDDEIDILDELGFYVEKYNKFDSCITCINPFEALEEAKKVNFEIALLDIDMPEMNGLELAEQLNNIVPNISIAFITAYNSYAAEAFEVNAIDYVLKPIRELRIIKTLDKLIDKETKKNQIKLNEAQIYIKTFGKFVIRIGDNAIVWKRKKSSELFAYLLENNKVPIHKERLCNLFWPDLEIKKALTSLQSTIYSIRRVIKDYNNDEIKINYFGDNYMLNIGKVNIDWIEFEDISRKALELKDENLLKKALELYTGNYLDEDGWLWAEPKKEKLRKEYMRLKKALP